MHYFIHPKCSCYCINYSQVCVVLQEIRAHVPGWAPETKGCKQWEQVQRSGLNLDKPTPQTPQTGLNPFTGFHRLKLPVQHLRARFTNLLIHKLSSGTFFTLHEINTYSLKERNRKSFQLNRWAFMDTRLWIIGAKSRELISDPTSDEWLNYFSQNGANSGQTSELFQPKNALH